MWARFWNRLRFVGRRNRFDRELAEEMDFHRAMLDADAARAGSTEPSARTTRHRLGNVLLASERARDAWTFRWIEALARDVRLAVRGLVRAPLVAAVAIASLAIGMGANTAVLSLIDRVFWRDLPVSHPEQLVATEWGASSQALQDALTFWNATGRGDVDGWLKNTFSWPVFADLRTRAGTHDGVLGFVPITQISASALGRSVLTSGLRVSGNYFSELGMRPVAGRLLNDDDDRTSGLPSAVISEGLWTRSLGRDPSALGATLHVNGRPTVIVGVMPRAFFGLSANRFNGTPAVDVVLPIRTQATMATGEAVDWWGADQFWVQVVARVRSNDSSFTPTALARTVRAHLAAPARELLGIETPRVAITSVQRGIGQLPRADRQSLLILAAVAAMALLMACANVASLLLVRSATQQHERRLRLALGCSRRQLVRQAIVEAGVLTAIGAVAGVQVAAWLLRLLVAFFADTSLPISVDLSPDLRVLMLTSLLFVVATALVALFPALHATRTRAKFIPAATTHTSDRRAVRVAGILVATQIALAVVTVANAGLLTRSLRNLHEVPLGFSTDNVMTFDVVPSINGYAGAEVIDVYERIQDRLERTPGVIAASLSSSRLISGYMSNTGFVVNEGTSASTVRSTYNVIGPGFFDVMRMPLVLGRAFTRLDMHTTPLVAIVNETAAKRFFGDASPLGRQIRWQGSAGRTMDVIGVVRDARYDRLRGDIPPTVYLPYTQQPAGAPRKMSFAVRTVNTAAAASIHEAVAAVDPLLPLVGMRTQEAQIDATLVPDRLFASLTSALGAVTALLAGIGLYGLVAYAVSTRRREIGIRMALGARRVGALRIVLRQIAVMLAGGLAIGVVGVWWFSRLIEGQLFGVTSHDPLSVLGGALLVIVVSLLAASRPLFAALRVDPVQALRTE